MQTTIAKNLATWATSAPANYDLTRRDLAPPGRAPDCLPQGGTPAPARPFLTAPRARIVLSLSISAISATLMCTIVFVTVFFSSLLGRSWRVLSPLDRLLGSLGLLLGPPGALLATSWRLLRCLGGVLGPLGRLLGRLGGVLGPLGRLLGRLGAIPNSIKKSCSKKPISSRPNAPPPQPEGGVFGSQNRSKTTSQTSQN